MEELLARLRALLRRQRPTQSNALCVGALQMDLLSHQVQYAGQSIELTNKEFALLELLMTHAPSPVTKTKMIEQVWNQHFDSGTNLINVYVNRLRGKIETGKAAGVSIRTIRGVGFALVDHKES
ncbi:MAG: winged helix-turn-helix domain-containing protein [Limisphaerales bacterium]